MTEQVLVHRKSVALYSFQNEENPHILMAAMKIHKGWKILPHNKQPLCSGERTSTAQSLASLYEYILNIPTGDIISTNI